MLDAYHLAAVGTRDELRRAVLERGRGSSERALLRAVAKQYDGDVDGAVRILREEMRSVDGLDLAAVADTLAPILVMRHDNSAVLVAARAIERAGWTASAYAFRALAAADTGERAAARRNVATALGALEEEDLDDVMRFRVLQRLARTAFYLDDHERAVDLALASAKLSSALGAWRAAAAAYSIAYNVHHNVTGDAREADRYARLCHAAAAKSGDESFVQGAVIAEYALAVQFADDARIERLEGVIRARLFPQQYTERFALGLAYAMVRGVCDLVAMRTLLSILRETAGRSRGEWALCTALIAVAEAAQAQDEDARRSARSALARLGRPARQPAYERRYRRLARSVAAAACVLVGDDVRAARTIATRESREGDGEDRLPALMRSGDLAQAPLPLRGIARVLAAAHAARAGHEPPAGLTRAEVDVLRLLGRGWSAGKIADETGRSVNTIYNHTRSILGKLDASRSSEALVKARERGLLV